MAVVVIAEVAPLTVTLAPNVTVDPIFTVGFLNVVVLEPLMVWLEPEKITFDLLLVAV